MAVTIVFPFLAWLLLIGFVWAIAPRVAMRMLGFFFGVLGAMALAIFLIASPAAHAFMAEAATMIAGLAILFVFFGLPVVGALYLMVKK